MSLYSHLRVHFLITFLLPPLLSLFSFFFFTDTATSVIYTLSLHDALPISSAPSFCANSFTLFTYSFDSTSAIRSEEHTSELQSRGHLVCRLLLEKKKNKNNEYINKNKLNKVSLQEKYQP